MSVLRVGSTLPGPLLVLAHTRISPDQHPALNRWQGGEGTEQGLVNGNGSLKPEDGSISGEGPDSEDEQQQQQQQQQRPRRRLPKAGGDAMEVDGQQQQQEKVPVLLVSRKQSLLCAAAEGKLPASTGEVSAGAVLPGYVASVTRDGGEGGVLVCLFGVGGGGGESFEQPGWGGGQRLSGYVTSVTRDGGKRRVFWG